MFYQDNEPAHTSSQALAAIQNVGFMGGFMGPRGPWPPKCQKSPFALCIIALQLQVMQALIHCPFNTNTADTCQLNPISGL